MEFGAPEKLFGPRSEKLRAPRGCRPPVLRRTRFSRSACAGSPRRRPIRCLSVPTRQEAIMNRDPRARSRQPDGKARPAESNRETHARRWWMPGAGRFTGCASGARPRTAPIRAV